MSVTNLTRWRVTEATVSKSRSSQRIAALPHRHPAENGSEQPLFLEPAGQRTSGIEKLELYDRAHRDHSCGQLLGPEETQLARQDPEQGRSVNEVDGGPAGVPVAGQPPGGRR